MREIIPTDIDCIRSDDDDDGKLLPVALASFNDGKNGAAVGVATATPPLNDDNDDDDQAHPQQFVSLEPKQPHIQTTELACVLL
jgi:hypothetical protein